MVNLITTGILSVTMWYAVHHTRNQTLPIINDCAPLSKLLTTGTSILSLLISSSTELLIVSAINLGISYYFINKILRRSAT